VTLTTVVNTAKGASENNSAAVGSLIQSASTMLTAAKQDVWEAATICP